MYCHGTLYQYGYISRITKYMAPSGIRAHICINNSGIEEKMKHSTNWWSKSGFRIKNEITISIINKLSKIHPDNIISTKDSIIYGGGVGGLAPP